MKNIVKLCLLAAGIGAIAALGACSPYPYYGAYYPYGYASPVVAAPYGYATPVVAAPAYGYAAPVVAMPQYAAPVVAMPQYAAPVVAAPCHCR